MEREQTQKGGRRNEKAKQATAEAAAQALAASDFELAVSHLLRHRLADHKRLELPLVRAGTPAQKRMAAGDLGCLSRVPLAPDLSRKGRDLCHCALFGAPPVPAPQSNPTERDPACDRAGKQLRSVPIRARKQPLKNPHPPASTGVRVFHIFGKKFSTGCEKACGTLL